MTRVTFDVAFGCLTDARLFPTFVRTVTMMFLIYGFHCYAV